MKNKYNRHAIYAFIQNEVKEPRPKYNYISPDGAWRVEDIIDRNAKLTNPPVNFSISPDDVYRNTGL